MKIKKFNESIEWLDRETVTLRDLTGGIKSTVNPHPDFSKIEFERGCLFISKDTYDYDIKSYLDEEFTVYMAKYKGLPDPETVYQDPNIQSKYTYAYLIKKPMIESYIRLVGIFDTKGNLVFFSENSTKMFLFGDVFSFEKQPSLVSVNLVTHDLQIIPYFYR